MLCECCAWSSCIGRGSWATERMALCTAASGVDALLLSRFEHLAGLSLVLNCAWKAMFTSCLELGRLVCCVTIVKFYLPGELSHKGVGIVYSGVWRGRSVAVKSHTPPWLDWSDCMLCCCERGLG